MGGIVFLAGVACPGVVHKTGSELPADGLCGIGGAGVDHDNLVGDSLQRRETAAYVAFFVLGDDYCGYACHVFF